MDENNFRPCNFIFDYILIIIHVKINIFFFIFYIKSCLFCLIFYTKLHIYSPWISINTYSDLHPVLNLMAQSEIPEVTMKLVLSLFS